MNMHLVHTSIQTGANINPLKPSLLSAGRSMSYAEMINAVDTIAEVLIVEGIRKGDAVMVQLRDQAQMLVSLYAVMRAGAVAIPVPGELDSDAVAAIARRCSPEALITARSDLRGHTTLADQLLCPFMLADAILETRRQNAGETTPAFREFSSHGFDRITILMDIGSDDEAIRCYPRGGTGEPASYSHRDLVTAGLLARKNETIDAARIEWIITPFSDIAGILRAFCIHSACGTVVTHDRANDVAGFAAEFNCNSLAATSEEIPALIERGPVHLMPLRSAILHIDVSVRLMAVDSRAIQEIFPHAEVFFHRDYPILPYATLLNLTKHPNKFETVGRAIGEASVNICDDQGKLVSRPQCGEVVIRMPRRSSAVRNRRIHSPAQEWRRTGDIGYLDREGYLHVMAQQFEPISVNGVQFSPLRMEDRVRLVYNDCEIGIIGIPDPTGELGEIPVFCYHPRNGTQITSADLSRLLSEEFDQYQIPRIVCRTEAFPRRGTILMRGELRLRVLAALSQPRQQVRS